MTKRRTLLGLAAGVAFSALTAGSALAADVTLKLHQFLPPQANVPKYILDVWADQVEEASEGRIEIERYHGMALGGAPPELMDQAIDGVADIVWTVIGYTPGRFPSTEVFELPFMVADARAASYAYWKMFEEHMKDSEFADVHVLATHVHGPGMFHTSDPVEVPADLEGMKIRGGSRMVNDLLERVGATPVGMPDDLRAILDENSGLELSVFMGGTQQDYDDPARATALDLGNNIVTVSEEDAAAWGEIVNPIYESWVADMDGKGIDGQALIDQARALMAEYEANN